MICDDTESSTNMNIVCKICRDPVIEWTYHCFLPLRRFLYSGRSELTEHSYCSMSGRLSILCPTLSGCLATLSSHQLEWVCRIRFFQSSRKHLRLPRFPLYRTPPFFLCQLTKKVLACLRPRLDRPRRQKALHTSGVNTSGVNTSGVNTSGVNTPRW